MNSVTWPLGISGVLFVFVALGTGAPAPFSRRAAWLPVEADGLRLVLRSDQREVKHSEVWTPERGPAKHQAEVSLSNLSSQHRELKMRSHTGGLDFDCGISYLLRFPGGEMLEMGTFGYAPIPRLPEQEMQRLQNDPPPTRLLRLTSRGCVRSSVDLCDKPESFGELFKKYDGKFCMSAVVGWLGLQSNLVRYNGCPEPPRDYRPLSHTKFKPEKWRGVDVDGRLDDPDMEGSNKVFFLPQLWWMRELNKDKR